jgi:hypothetical protein
MPIKSQIITLWYALIASVVVAIALAIGARDQRWLWLATPVLSFVAFRLRRLRCPRCGQLVLLKSVRAAGFNWLFARPNQFPSACEECGLSFR